ncbi:MAG: hypothetical protein A2189_04265 [Paenibacillus sp. RIFOXYA1_FULL_44_5]|nr:MAG: hypothetical protein A2189_04265 [Paenibacillus sp. RIFOXYA1_FULL_44_5]
MHFGNAGGQTANIQTKDLHASCRSVLGFSLGTTRQYRPHVLREVSEKVIGYLQSGALNMVIGHRFSLQDARMAHELIENRGSRGKILLMT